LGFSLIDGAHGKSLFKLNFSRQCFARLRKHYVQVIPEQLEWVAVGWNVFEPTDEFMPLMSALLL
jgi:hypothetical protein